MEHRRGGAGRVGHGHALVRVREHGEKVARGGVRDVRETLRRRGRRGVFRRPRRRRRQFSNQRRRLRRHVRTRFGRRLYPCCTRVSDSGVHEGPRAVPGGVPQERGVRRELWGSAVGVPAAAGPRGRSAMFGPNVRPNKHALELAPRVGARRLWWNERLWRRTRENARRRRADAQGDRVGTRAGPRRADARFLRFVRVEPSRPDDCDDASRRRDGQGTGRANVAAGWVRRRGGHARSRARHGGVRRARALRRPFLRVGRGGPAARLG
mmetsp:Transcript_12586/g.50575  ORF Transcript_12586/g.50575 Transcript_12586/m.50575 type:complete len:267 (-) Transcript_12586:2674-3474(-)